MEILNFLNSNSFFRKSPLRVIKKEFLLYKLSYILKFNFNFSYIFKLEELEREENIFRSLNTFLVYKDLLENFFKPSGLKLKVDFSKGKKKIFRKSNDKLDFCIKLIGLKEQKRIQYFSKNLIEAVGGNSYLSDFLLSILHATALFTLLRNWNFKLNLFVKRYNGVLIIGFSKDFINFLLIFLKKKKMLYCYDRLSFIKIVFSSDVEASIVYQTLVKDIQNIKNGGEKNIL